MIVRKSLEEIAQRAARRRKRLEPWPDGKIRDAAARDADSWLPNEAELRSFAPSLRPEPEFAERTVKYDPSE